jgi:lipid-binding SYLF domain-containing protein
MVVGELIRARLQVAEDAAAEVLARATGISVHPQPMGRLASGFYPEGRSDAGVLQIDDVELVPAR